ncbi:hypothetical protein G4B88_026148 [Cannabis sativa]|uniref:Retrotransposon Copia-like N-terminal domain-containing protein n=1 Tax=Cannabis sativa TaxID=3483 RepID=A0A7J6HCE1_CANSA|nr:hypothetical protein G4B88_026148 [Cannabis sativa]
MKCYFPKEIRAGDNSCSTSQLNLLTIPLENLNYAPNGDNVHTDPPLRRPNLHRSDRPTPEDPSSRDHPGLILVSSVLTVANYQSWKHAISIYFSSPSSRSLPWILALMIPLRHLISPIHVNTNFFNEPTAPTECNTQ